MKIWRDLKLLPKISWNFFTLSVMMELIVEWREHVFWLVESHPILLTLSVKQYSLIYLYWICPAYQTIVDDTKSGFLRTRKVRSVLGNHFPLLNSTLSSAPLLQRNISFSTLFYTCYRYGTAGDLFWLTYIFCFGGLHCGFIKPVILSVNWYV